MAVLAYFLHGRRKTPRNKLVKLALPEYIRQSGQERPLDVRLQLYVQHMHWKGGCLSPVEVFHPSTWKAEVKQISETETILVYRASYRTARVPQRNPVLINKNIKQNNNKN